MSKKRHIQVPICTEEFYQKRAAGWKLHGFEESKAVGEPSMAVMEAPWPGELTRLVLSHFAAVDAHQLKPSKETRMQVEALRFNLKLQDHYRHEDLCIPSCCEETQE